MESRKAAPNHRSSVSSNSASDQGIAGRRAPVKIDAVEIDNRRAELRIHEAGKVWLFPYAKLRLKPEPDNPIIEAFPDPEMGYECFTYFLASGDTDSIHLDNVKALNRDPDTMVDWMLYKLTDEALDSIEESGMGIRQLARMMDTSPAQIYRLLETTNYSKSIGQMIRLLYLLGKDVRLEIKPLP